MDDNKNLNQPNTTTPNNDDYQKILDEYAASIKPEEDVNSIASPAEDTIKLEAVKEDNLSLKDINSLQLEAPEIAQPLNIEPPVLNQPPKVTETKPNIETPIVSQPTTETKTPEEIKAQIDKIFADDSSSTSFPPKKTKSFAKNFFFLSIVIFFLVAAGWIYFLYFYQQSTNNTNVSTVSPTPTKVVSQETCELNGTTYKVGESFKSADGCNTCSCQTANTIACTEMACNISPVVTPVATKSASTKTVTVTPTKSVTTSSVPKDWKTYTNKEIGFSFQYSPQLTFPSSKMDGNLFLLSVNSNGNIFVSSVNIGITGSERGAGFADAAPYTKSGSTITTKSSGKIDSRNIKKIYTNPNGIEIVLINDTSKFSPGGEDEPDYNDFTKYGNTGALINTKSKIYPGLTFQVNSVIKEADLLKILDTLKFN